MSDIYEDLVNAIKAHADLDDDEWIIEAGEHGADAGWSGFTYYTDTIEFFNKNKATIRQLVFEMAEGLGNECPLDFVAGFRCVDDDAETRLAIGRCLFGDPLDEDYLVQNALSWFALEEAGRWLEAQKESV